MRDDVNVPGTPLAETEFIPMTVEEAMELIRQFEKSHGTFVKSASYHKKRMLGINTRLAIVDEITSFVPRSISQASSEDDSS